MIGRNVRELRNVVERVTFFTKNNYIESFGLSLKTSWNKSVIAEISDFVLPDDPFSIKDLEKEIIKKALLKFDNNKTKTAAYLKLTRSALRSRIKTHGLD